jgi:AraC-like DNA-binding protein
VCQFRLDFLGPELLARPEFGSLRKLLERAQRGLAFPPNPDIAEAVRRLDELAGPMRTLVLLRTLVELAEANNERPLATPEFRPRRRDDIRSRMDAIFTFVHREFAGPIGLTDVAAIAHMSPACSRFFHRVTGHTFTGYLTELRIGAACRMLIETDLTVATVSARSGFRNLANFNRQFRASKQLSPREYRAQSS